MQSPSDAASGDRRQLLCDSCGSTDFDGGDDGFFYCLSCGSMSQDLVATGVAAEDTGLAAEGGLYSLRHRRHTATPKPSSGHLPHSLSQTPKPEPNTDRTDPNARKPCRFEQEEKEEEEEERMSEPRDFGSSVFDGNALAAGVRSRYVRGLQVMLQRQLEVMVERFGVSPMVCGIAGTVWLRHVAASRVFDEMWAQKVAVDAEAATVAAQDGEPAADDQQPSKDVKAKYSLESDDSNGRRVVYLLLRALRKMLPVYSTLAICFLVCHIAREAILPTDIYEWAIEGKLPYITAFTELDSYLGSPSIDCPLSARQLFRPVRVIGAWQLEATAGSIAQSIGLCLPSVNFYAVAYRYLNELSLPVEKILPHACRVYEWALPAELWLSSNADRFPTRVCVISILIVTIRVLYNIHGQGTWEMTGKTSMDLGAFNAIGNSLPTKKSVGSNSSEFNTEELLSILEAAYDKISIKYDFSKDLHSYLKYCKDVVFAGIPVSFEEETLVKIFWDLYNNREDEGPQEDVKSNSQGLKGKRSRDGVATCELFNSLEPQEEQKETMHVDRVRQSAEQDDTVFGKRPKRDGVFVDPPCMCRNRSACSRSFAPSTYDVLEKMKLEMEEHGFCYLPPRNQLRSDGYLHYKRKRVGGILVYAAHADYYILLRAFARLAQVDARIMHVGILKLERKLAWIEQRIEISLNTLQNLHGKANNELRPVSG